MKKLCFMVNTEGKGVVSGLTWKGAKVVRQIQGKAATTILADLIYYPERGSLFTGF